MNRVKYIRTKDDEIEDLGYAVVIDDEGNEIKNY